MLKISQSLGSSQVKDYYTKEYIAKENYWQQDAEAPGQWHGKLAEDMGLTGAIDYQSFSNLAEGKNAAGDTQLVRHIDRAGYTNEQGTFVQPVEHRAAWDAVFSAPKSVSLTALVGGDERIIEATAKPSMWHSAALRHSPRPASPPTQQRRPADYLPPSLSIKPLARSMDTPPLNSIRTLSCST